MGLFDSSYVIQRRERIEAAQILSKAGGKARAKALSSKRKKEIAKTAANARWKPMLAGKK